MSNRFAVQNTAVCRLRNHYVIKIPPDRTENRPRQNLSPPQWHAADVTAAAARDSSWQLQKRNQARNELTWYNESPHLAARSTIIGEASMSDAELRKQLYNSFKHRALLYYLIFDELRTEIGEERATTVLERAIRRRGEAIGQQFAEYGPDDLEGLRNAFLKIIPDQGQMFSPNVTRCDSDGLDITLQTCPLKDAWQEAGLEDAEVAKLCRIAAAIDTGTFEAAGFSFAAETWKPGSDGCCHLKIRPSG
jgi:hypothetical protein